MSRFSKIRSGFIRFFLSFKLGRFLMRMAISIIVPKHRIGVNVVCVDEENNILLLKHLFHPLAPWGLPGGWMDRNESPVECALRELKEETGLENVSLKRPLSVVRNPAPDHINLIFEIKVEGNCPETKLDKAEIVDSDWVTPNSVPGPLTAETIFAMKEVWALKDIKFDYPDNQILKSSF